MKDFEDFKRDCLGDDFYDKVDAAFERMEADEKANGEASDPWSQVAGYSALLTLSMLNRYHDWLNS